MTLCSRVLTPDQPQAACCAGVSRWPARPLASQLLAGRECHCDSATRAGPTSYKENAGPQTIDVLAEAKSLVELEGSESQIRSAGRKETTSNAC